MERRRSIVIFAAWTVCILFNAACGEKSATPIKEERAPDTASSIPAASPSLPLNSPVIVTFGDSLTAGVAGRSYPDQLQDLLLQHGFKYRVENQGVSGDTTTDGLSRIDNVIAPKPALVLLEFGGNDGLRGLPVDATRQNLVEMIARIKNANISLVLLGITLPPNYGPDYVKPFTAMFPDLAQKYRIPLIPFLLTNVYRDPQLMQPDGIHPNGNGNRVVAQDVYNLITPLLNRSPK